uniref:Putative DNA repair protein XRCC2-like n=1 Tax=Solanum chacoense TaxID=4108 RepID=A0A0V0IE43_SOLCH
MQAAINCILPKEWKGVNYGGLERLVMFVDLDCRFDVLSLSRLLKQRIIRANGNGIGHKLNKVDNSPSSKDAHTEYDKELFAASMRRFLYIRCYDSFEFLATLKTLHFQLQKEKEAHGSGVYLLMIDSIGAFYWMDRASPSIPPGSNNRRSLSLQSVSDIAVQEIQKILVVHPMLVLTTKAASLQDKFTSREVIRSTGQLSIESNLDSRTIGSSTNAQLYREYMPSVWQSFVSHRILVRPSDDNKYPKQPIYLSEWLLPSLKLADKFTSNDDGTYIVS